MAIDRLPNFSLYWLGWNSSIFDLARDGWTYHIDTNYYVNVVTLALTNSRFNIVGISEYMSYDLFKELRGFNNSEYYYRGKKYNDNNWYPTIKINSLSFKGTIKIVAHSAMNHSFKKVDFVEIDPMTHQTIDLSELFPKNNIQDNKIIVPEYTIPELLQMVKEKQAPMQKEIRERLAREKHTEKLEAQIISIN